MNNNYDSCPDYEAPFAIFWGTLNLIIGNTVLGNDPVERNIVVLGCYGMHISIPALSCCNIM